MNNSPYSLLSRYNIACCQRVEQMKVKGVGFPPGTLELGACITVTPGGSKTSQTVELLSKIIACQMDLYKNIYSIQDFYFLH